MSVSLQAADWHPEVEIRFGDADRAGHVHHATVLVLAEAGRLRWLRACERLLSLSLTDPMIIARAELDYRAPIPGQATAAEVELQVLQVGRSSFGLRHRIRPPRSTPNLPSRPECWAEARLVLVHYDYTTARPQPLPPAFAELLRAAVVDEAGQLPDVESAS